MNSIYQNFARSAAGFLKIPLPRLSYSTATNVAESPACDEPDKLYKTIEIELRANEPETMKSYVKFATMAAGHLDINVGRQWTPYKPHYERDNLCLLRSCFVNKDCRVQYEVRTYYNFMKFHQLTGSTADTFLEYLERNLPEGISMKITKVAVEKLPEEITASSTEPLPDETESSNTS